MATLSDEKFAEYSAKLEESVDRLLKLPTDDTTKAGIQRLFSGMIGIVDFSRKNLIEVREILEQAKEQMRIANSEAAEAKLRETAARKELDALKKAVGCPLQKRRARRAALNKQHTGI